MRRLAVLLVAVLGAAGGAGALARKAPPHHAKRHHHRRRPAAKRPAPVTTPAPPVAAPSAPPADPAPPTPAAPPPPPTTTAPAAAPLAHTLGVTASDAAAGGFVLSLSRTVLGAGPESIQFRNVSQDGHDLRIDDVGGAQQAVWDELPSLAAPVSQAVTLPPGAYRVYCTLHPGMSHQLTVQ